MIIMRSNLRVGLSFFRYEKMHSAILEWEKEKKQKSRRKLEHKEVFPPSLAMAAHSKLEELTSYLWKLAGAARAEKKSGLTEAPRRGDEDQQDC